jgi:tetratricopeptide (TPR) repeat protein
MRNFGLIILVMFFVLSCSFDKTKATDHFNQAKAYFEENDLKNALTEVNTAIKLDSTNLDIQLLRAKIFHKTENYEQAITILQTLLQNGFKSDTVDYLLAKLYSQYSSFLLTKVNQVYSANDANEKAILHYNSVIDRNPHHYEAYLGKSKSLHNLKRYNEALITINSATKLFPDSLCLISYRGIAKLVLGDLKGALKDLNQAIESKQLDSSDLAEAFRFRGRLYYLQGDELKAILDLTTAIEYRPSDYYIFSDRAMIYKEMGQKDNACDDYRHAADLGYLKMYEIIKEYCND